VLLLLIPQKFSGFGGLPQPLSTGLSQALSPSPSSLIKYRPNLGVKERGKEETRRVTNCLLQP